MPLKSKWQPLPIPKAGFYWLRLTRRPISNEQLKTPEILLSCAHETPQPMKIMPMVVTLLFNDAERMAITMKNLPKGTRWQRVESPGAEL